MRSEMTGNLTAKTPQSRRAPDGPYERSAPGRHMSRKKATATNSPSADYTETRRDSRTCLSCGRRPKMQDDGAGLATSVPPVRARSRFQKLRSTVVNEAPQVTQQGKGRPWHGNTVFGEGVLSPENQLNDNQRRKRLETLAIAISVGISAVLLVVKWGAYYFTGSVAVLSDASESVVHLAAVVFAAWSMRMARKPPDREHLYGHDKIAFFSAGAEGALVALAGAGILWTAVSHLIERFVPQHLEVGIAISGLVVVLNGVGGWWIQRVGKQTGNLILVANGRHVASDAVTSGGVLVTLALIALTGWYILDPLVGLLVAGYLMKSGYELVRTSLGGLMDASDPEQDAQIRKVLEEWAKHTGGQYHGLRHRRSGQTTWIELHLLLPGHLTLEEAHRAATELESELYKLLGGRGVVTTHLEPLEAHEDHHPEGDPGQEQALYAR